LERSAPHNLGVRLAYSNLVRLTFSHSRKGRDRGTFSLAFSLSTWGKETASSSRESACVRR
jgi:hypothetical protein